MYVGWILLDRDLNVYIVLATIVVLDVKQDLVMEFIHQLMSFDYSCDHRSRHRGKNNTKEKGNKVPCHVYTYINGRLHVCVQLIILFSAVWFTDTAGHVVVLLYTVQFMLM